MVKFHFLSLSYQKSFSMAPRVFDCTCFCSGLVS